MTHLVNAFATFYLTGLVWFVQTVHYPLFRRIPADAFREYHQIHRRLTTLVVAGPMIIELVTAVLLLWVPSPLTQGEAWVSLALLGGIWLSTLLLQAPQHAQLERSFDFAVVDALVQGNWIRTALWSARAALWLFVLLRPAGVGD